MRRNRTFAYDLIVHYGAVNSRVVLLLRSIEAKPKMSPPSLNFPVVSARCYLRVFREVETYFRGCRHEMCWFWEVGPAGLFSYRLDFLQGNLCVSRVLRENKAIPAAYPAIYSTYPRINIFPRFPKMDSILADLR